MKRILGTLGFCILALAAHADEVTATRTISNLRFDGSDNNKTIYFESTTGNWGAPSCPNAQFVMVRGIEGLKELLALGTTAKATDLSVSFRGQCVDATYFSAYYIVVQ